MPLYAIDDAAPVVEAPDTGWIASDARVIGNVRIGREVGIWFGAVIRADNEPIKIGDRTNVQEQVIMHTDPGAPLTIGAGCTIGHRALLHGCTIEEGSLVGMGAIILNRAVIGAQSLVGAGALVTEDKIFPPRSLIVGAPAKAVRTLSDDEVAGLGRSARNYVENQQRFSKGLKPVD